MSPQLSNLAEKRPTISGPPECHRPSFGHKDRDWNQFNLHVDAAALDEIIRALDPPPATLAQAARRKRRLDKSPRLIIAQDLRNQQAEQLPF